MVTSCLGLANVELDDEHVLTDKLTPRKFSLISSVCSSSKTIYPFSICSHKNKKTSMKTRFIVPVIFLAAIILGCYFSNKCPYAFDVGSIPRTKETISSIADRKIAESFGKNNTLAVIIPRGDYEKEKPQAVIFGTKFLCFVLSIALLNNINNPGINKNTVKILQRIMRQSYRQIWVLF